MVEFIYMKTKPGSQVFYYVPGYLYTGLELLFSSRANLADRLVTSPA